MLKFLNLEDEMSRERISKRGILEPPLHILYAYGKAANVYMEIFVNDEVKLPKEIPSKYKFDESKNN